MLLIPNVYKSLNSVETISTRIMTVSFNKNTAVTTVSCYRTTNVSDEEDKDEIYIEITTVTRSIPKHNILLLGDDKNARISIGNVIDSV